MGAVSMKGPDQEGVVVRTLNSYWTAIVAILITVAGLLVLFASAHSPWWEGQPTWQAFLSQLGGLLVVTGGLSLLWDLKGRRAFANEVLAKAQVGADIRSSGLQRVSMQWLSDVDWQQLFSNSREIEVFLSYGTSWRNVHWPSIEQFSQKKSNKFRIYLPDPEDATSVGVLARRYGSTHDKLRANIIDAAEAYSTLQKIDNGADVRIYYRRGDPTFACYRFDDEIVVTLYSHKRTRGEVPTFVCGRGSLFTFFAHELVEIRAQSVEQSFVEKKIGEA